MERRNGGKRRDSTAAMLPHLVWDATNNQRRSNRQWLVGQGDFSKAVDSSSAAFPNKARQPVQILCADAIVIGSSKPAESSWYDVCWCGSHRRDRRGICGPTHRRRENPPRLLPLPARNGAVRGRRAKRTPRCRAVTHADREHLSCRPCLQLYRAIGCSAHTMEAFLTQSERRNATESAISVTGSAEFGHSIVTQPR